MLPSFGFQRCTKSACKIRRLASRRCDASRPVRSQKPCLTPTVIEWRLLKQTTGQGPGADLPRRTRPNRSSAGPASCMCTLAAGHEPSIAKRLCSLPLLPPMMAARHSPTCCSSRGCLTLAPAPAAALSNSASAGWLQLSFSTLCGKVYFLPTAAASGTVCCRRLHLQLQQLRQQSRAQAGVDAVAPRSARRNARTPLSRRTDAAHVSDDGRDGWGKKEGPSRSRHYLRDNSSPQGWEKVNYAHRVALLCSVPQRCRQAISRAHKLSCGPPLASQARLGKQGLLLAFGCWPGLSSRLC